MKTKLSKITINQYLVIGIAALLFIVGTPNITSGLGLLQFLDDSRVEPVVVWNSILTTAGFDLALVGVGTVLLVKAKLIGNLIHTKNKNWLLVAVAIFLVVLPWLQNINVGFNNEVMVDGITVSAAIVMVITLAFSLISWILFAWASKKFSLAGVLLGIVSAASIILPFLKILGPMAGVIVGVVAGFVAFMFQKTMYTTSNHPMIIAAVTLVAAYAVLSLVILAVIAHSSMIWDTGDGVGSWTGTPEGTEESKFDYVIKNDIGIVLFAAIIPSLIMTALIIRRKNEN